ncbi:MAG: sel1 repeat family protein [Rhodanobacteraceae bacterium]|nr:MAG: sel1 repeat family protein [Rhodanobacteraceae bacterium]
MIIVMAAQAQTTRASGEIAAPNYSSCIANCAYTDNFNTPESDGRPGVKFYSDGMKAYEHKDYEHGIYMLKIAASWAYKPAEYNLGVIYFKGMGVPANRPLGAAWMFLAAERGTSPYLYARHVMVMGMDSAERTEAYALLQKLEKTYGDKVALRRAKAQWAFTKASTTGSRLGYTGDYLMVGSGGGVSGPALYGKSKALPNATGVPVAANGWAVFKNGDITDGSIAYRQFQDSSNPYDPIFVNNRTGTATVGPLEQVKTDNDKQPPSKKKDNSASPSTQPPRNA